jgi:hypothetical protein
VGQIPVPPSLASSEAHPTPSSTDWTTKGSTVGETYR